MRKNRTTEEDAILSTRSAVIYTNLHTLLDRFMCIYNYKINESFTTATQNLIGDLT